MKKYLLLFLAILIPSVIFAVTTVPWAKNLNTEYPLYINDLIGVGTSSPYCLLCVATPNNSLGAQTVLFNISSSTAIATTSAFTVFNNNAASFGTTTNNANQVLIGNGGLTVDGNGGAPFINVNGQSTSVGPQLLLNDQETANNKFSFTLNPSGTAGTNNQNQPLNGVIQTLGGTTNGLTIKTQAGGINYYTGGTSLTNNFVETMTAGQDVGIGTTTPGSLLSIGNTGGINIIPTATSTFGSSANGINLTNGCFAIGGNCLTQNSGTVTSVGLSSTNSTLIIGSTPVTTSGTITADLNFAHGNTWTALQQFNGNASTTIFSNYGTEYIGGTATTTINGNNATSTFQSGFVIASSTGQQVASIDQSGDVILSPTATGTVYTQKNAAQQNVETINTTSISAAPGSDIFELASSTGTTIFNVNGFGDASTTRASYANSFINTGASPTIATSTGSGVAGATATIIGGNNGGEITVNTAGTPTLGATIVTITPSFPAPNNWYCTISPSNASTQALASGVVPRVGHAQSTWSMTAGATALTTSTTYSWEYTCIAQ